MGRKVIVLHSSLTPIAVAHALRSSIDEEHWTLFSLSGYQGARRLLGEVGEDTFRVQKRKYYQNAFARQFYARFAPEPGGTRIEGYFDMRRSVRYFMLAWLAFAVLVGSPIFVRTVIEIVMASQYMSSDKWVGLVVPPGLVLGGTLLPAIGRLIGRNNERSILEHVQKTLAARIEDVA
jgi:hypothetical protein